MLELLSLPSSTQFFAPGSHSSPLGVQNPLSLCGHPQLPVELAEDFGLFAFCVVFRKAFVMVCYGCEEVIVFGALRSPTAMSIMIVAPRVSGKRLLIKFLIFVYSQKNN